MKIDFLKLDVKAAIPTRAHPSDAGLDLVAVEKYNDDYGNIVYDTKIALAIPEGYCGLLFPRSSVSKYTLSLANSVGLIDSSYRGSLMLKFKPTPYYKWKKDAGHYDYEIGDKCGQLVIMALPQVELNEVSTLSDTVRGKGGFGSSDEKNTTIKDYVK